MSGLGSEILLLLGPSGVTDQSGNGNDGTYNGGMGVVANTESGGVSAFDLDGTDDFISTPSIASGTGDWSYGFWTKLDADFNQDFLSNRSLGASGAQPGFVIGHNGTGTVGQLQIQVDSGAGAWVNNTYSSVLSTGVWMHFVVTFDNSTAEIKTYKNGVLLTPASSTTSGTPAGANYSSGNSVIIGGRPGTTTRCVNGLMDGIFVVDSVLSAHEVMELYTGGRMYDRPTDPAGLGFELAIWRGDSGVVDVTGNGYNATQVGGLVPSDDGGIDVWNFDNVDDALSIPFGVLPSDYPFAVSFWAKKEAGDYTIGAISSSTSNSSFIYFGLNQTTPAKAVFNSTPPGSEKLGVAGIADGEWVFIVFEAASATSRKIYVNDASPVVDTRSSSPLSLCDRFNFGKLERPSTGYYAGSVNDIHVYDRTLTPEEITELYTGGQNYNRPASPTFNPAWAHNSTQVIA